MAHADNSIITGKFRGSLGKQLVFREWEGKTVVAKSPKRRTGAPSLQQEETQEQFLLASRYAKAVITNADQTFAEAYANALRPRQNVYSRALEDFMSPPKVKSITTRNYRGQVGDKIVVRANDDFRVTALRVEIYNPDGSLLEEGDAVQQANTLDWTYTVTLINAQLTGTTVRTIATDVPGNEGGKDVVM